MYKVNNAKHEELDFTAMVLIRRKIGNETSDGRRMVTKFLHTQRTIMTRNIVDVLSLEPTLPRVDRSYPYLAIK